MEFSDRHKQPKIAGTARSDKRGAFAWLDLAADLFNGRRPGESVKLREIAAKYHLDEAYVLKVFTEFQTVGMITLTGNVSATLHSPNPKEMQDAYEIRAALEEVGARSAARTLKGDTLALQRELDGMRVAFRNLDLNAFVKHDVAFHRTILQASQNQVLLRVWDSLAVDLRIRGVIGTISRDLPEVVESHQPIVDAFEHGRGREAGLLLRNHVETILEFLKKAESDSGLQRAFRSDLERAKDVQQAFFPQENLSIPGLVCEALYKPVQTIGGDYYDFIPLQTDRWGIAVGDVCGKGIGAALLMASLQASLRAQAMHSHSDLSALITDVHRLVLASSPKHLYASLFYAEYHAPTHELRYVNAGHNAPLVMRWKSDQFQLFRLEASGTPLGLLENSQFTSQTFQLQPGDILIMYTDGVTEAEDAHHEMWGQQRLETLLSACRNLTPAQIVNRIQDELRTFIGNRALRDDVTLVVVGVQQGMKNEEAPDARSALEVKNRPHATNQMQIPAR
ncbi:MAG TPA: SpoIIE family protein phosphatase [Candidatus Dormibacteraeota bacterium]|nr:SpoIIE family protein phosphatase [Candidatus Dormibacteraeota bacterium]